MPNPQRRPLVVANRKMNGSKAAIECYLQEVQPNFSIDLAIALPFPYLWLNSSIPLASQNVHWAECGAWTGEVSAEMLKDLGINWAIIGHSERRMHFGETDSMISQKVHRCIRHSGIGVILCLGESVRSPNAQESLQVVENQLKSAIGGLKDFNNLNIAYEPVWAIGSGIVPSAEQINSTLRHIRTILCKETNNSHSVRLLYGGSVNEKNVQEIAALDEVDGVLVGGASMNAKAFNAIAESFSKDR